MTQPPSSHQLVAALRSTSALVTVLAIPVAGYLAWSRSGSVLTWHAVSLVMAAAFALLLVPNLVHSLLPPRDTTTSFHDDLMLQGYSRPRLTIAWMIGLCVLQTFVIAVAMGAFFPSRPTGGLP